MAETLPNIIFIITDQQRYDTVGALGFPFMDTPVVDRLVQEGTAFNQCHVAGASCAPARGALFTGYYPHTTGIMKNGDLWRHTWLEHFQAAGYYTVNIGKMHTEPMNTPAGFHERFNVENKERVRPVPGVNRDYLDEWDRVMGLRGHTRPDRHYYTTLPEFETSLGAFDWPLPPELHPDVFVGDLGLWWLKRIPTRQPLFLQIGFPGPHPPYDPWAEEVQAYLDKDLPIQPATGAEMADQPPPIQDLRKLHAELAPDSAAHRADADMVDRKRQRAYYLANQTMIDRKIGEILETLKEKGYLDNAVVVFTSDHGDCLGDHGLNQKWSGYDQVTRVPLVLWGPGHVPAGRRVDGLVQQQDVVPWLMDLAGIEAPGTLEAESIAPALSSDVAVREAVYCEQSRDRFMTNALMTVVRTADWKLVHFLGEDYGQLFNLNDDPAEVQDCWNDPAAAGMKAELLDRLYEWRLRSQLQTSDWMEENR